MKDMNLTQVAKVDLQFTPGHGVGVFVSADPMDTIKVVLKAHGLYDPAEAQYGSRVCVETKPDGSRLVVQEDVSMHGSPLWETVRTITDDPKRIEAYLAAKKVVLYLKDIENKEVSK